MSPQFSDTVASAHVARQAGRALRHVTVSPAFAVCDTRQSLPALSKPRTLNKTQNTTPPSPICEYASNSVRGVAYQSRACTQRQTSLTACSSVGSENSHSNSSGRRPSAWSFSRRRLHRAFGSGRSTGLGSRLPARLPPCRVLFLGGSSSVTAGRLAHDLLSCVRRRFAARDASGH